jgi:hypothetical protein
VNVVVVKDKVRSIIELPKKEEEEEEEGATLPPNYTNFPFKKGGRYLIFCFFGGVVWWVEVGAGGFLFVRSVAGVCLCRVAVSSCTDCRLLC